MCFQDRAGNGGESGVEPVKLFYHFNSRMWVLRVTFFRSHTCVLLLMIYGSSELYKRRTLLTCSIVPLCSRTPSLGWSIWREKNKGQSSRSFKGSRKGFFPLSYHCCVIYVNVRVWFQFINTFACLRQDCCYCFDLVDLGLS